MKHELKNDIDVVPVINVSLVIVLTMMLISPFLAESELKVELPEAGSAEVKDEDKIEVTYTLEGEVAVNGTIVEATELGAILEAAFADNPSQMAVVKADRNLRYGDVEDVIATVQHSGAPRLALATDRKKRERG